MFSLFPLTCRSCGSILEEPRQEGIFIIHRCSGCGEEYKETIIKSPK